MASSSSVIWECIVCGRHVEDLLVLPCQHRFCDSCLNSWLVVYIDSYRGNGGHIPCQICWSLWRIPSNGLDGLKQNYYVYVLQGQFRDITIATEDSNSTLSLPTNTNTASTVDSNVADIGHGNISDPQDVQTKQQFFVSGHSYQNESSTCSSAFSPAIGTDSAMHQNDMDLDNNTSSHSGSAVIHENVISSSRVFHRNNSDGPSIGVCRRIEHYHDYDMYGAGHYY